MDNVRSFPGQAARNRMEVFRGLWSQGYGRSRMLQYALDNRLFDASQMELASTREGLEELFAIVKREFHEIQTEKVEKRRETIVQLLALGLNEREITQQCLDKKLMHNPSFQSAYFNVRKDIERMTRKMKAEDARYIEKAKSLYIRQQLRIHREAMIGANAAATGKVDTDGNYEPPDRRAQSALLMVAMKASDNVAIVNMVDIKGKAQESGAEFDLATEAGMAIIQKTEQMLLEAREREKYGSDDYELPRGAVIDVEQLPSASEG